MKWKAEYTLILSIILLIIQIIIAGIIWEVW